jgi:polysaccharide pyruvyl transferase WcaK-like protein
MDDILRAELAGPGPRIGFCVSAQRAIRDEGALVAVFDRLVLERDARIVFIPMNPLTDSKLMAGLRLKMKRPDRAFVLEGRYEPSEILAVASTMDVIASSRLHLLIFASIVNVPIIGISRGSKVDNFIGPFGLTSVGSVEECDFGALHEEALRLIDTKAAFNERSCTVRRALMARLDTARSRLARSLASTTKGTKHA